VSPALRAAERPAVDADEVLPFSTGVIGEDLPLAPITAALPALVARLRADGWTQAARAFSRPIPGPRAHPDISMSTGSATR
jgi:N-acetylglutamate synthase/N-acetylornithine aminotransferase